MCFRVSVYLLVAVFFLISCLLSKNINSNAAKENQAIDSLALVKSLPVCLSSDQPLFKLEIQLLLIEILKKSGYEIITLNETFSLLKDRMAKEYSDKEKIKELLDKSKTDKMFFLSSMEKIPPIFQSIKLRPCKDSSENCFVLIRGNPPGFLKSKQWIFNYKETDDYSNLINHVFKVLIE